jgi:hypothetical protein
MAAFGREEDVGDLIIGGVDDDETLGGRAKSVAQGPSCDRFTGLQEGMLAGEEGRGVTGQGQHEELVTAWG